MVLVPVGHDHQLEIRRWVDSEGTKVAESHGLPGFGIHAAVHADPLATPDMKQDALSAAGPKEGQFELVSFRRIVRESNPHRIWSEVALHDDLLSQAPELSTLEVAGTG